MPLTPDYVGPAERIQRSAAAAMWLGLVVIAAVLTLRRISGAFTEPLTAVPSGAVATTAAGLGLLAFHWTVRPRKAPSHAVLQPLFQLADYGLPAAAILLPPLIGAAVAAELSTPLLCFLAGLSGSVWLVCTLGSKLRLIAEQHFNALAGEGAEPTLRSKGTNGQMTTEREQSPADASSHRQSRSIDADGCDRLEGHLRIDFAAGQKQAVTHVPFSPPFARTPEVECEVLDDADVRLKPAAIYTYGVRLEARRSGDTSRPQSVPVGYEVRAA